MARASGVANNMPPLSGGGGTNGKDPNFVSDIGLQIAERKEQVWREGGITICSYSVNKILLFFRTFYNEYIERPKLTTQKTTHKKVKLNSFMLYCMFLIVFYPKRIGFRYC